MVYTLLSFVATCIPQRVNTFSHHTCFTEGRCLPISWKGGGSCDYVANDESCYCPGFGHHPPLTWRLPIPASWNSVWDLHAVRNLSHVEKPWMMTCNVTRQRGQGWSGHTASETSTCKASVPFWNASLYLRLFHFGYSSLLIGLGKHQQMTQVLGPCHPQERP